MKKTLFITIFILFTATIACEAQLPIIKDVRGDIYDDSAQIVVEANCEIDYIEYTLEAPSRLIIDPIGKIYSDLKEVIVFDAGPVKKVTIAKGRPEEGLTGNYYPLDFISIELSPNLEYKIRKEVKEEVIIELTKKKEEIPPLPPPKEEVKEEVVPLPEIRIERPKAEEAPPPVVQPLPAVAEGEIIPLEEPKQIEVPLEAPSAPTTLAFGYKIGEGDNLDISVWQHPELDKRVIVRPDGFISFPLAGDIKAVDLTPPQLASSVKEALSRLIKDPQVTVIVSGFGSKNIFVLGEVTKPGVYPFRGGISVLEAISSAGGWKNSAVLNSVMLVRRVFAETPEAHRLNVYNIIKHADASQNLTLQPGDVVYVPKSFVANIGGFIENLRVNIGAYITETTRVFD